MSTPEGWATATILFQLLRVPPSKGSHQELILQLFIMRREYQNSEETKLMLMSSLYQEKGKESVKELWKEHLHARFPWFVQMEEQEKAFAKAMLDKETERGAFQVTPLLPERKGQQRLGTLPTPPSTPSTKEPPRVPHQLRTRVPQMSERGGSSVRRRTRK